ncbi:hypothetical protein SAMN05444280_1722 [Tangfeifania diversioriginum]|uniref:Uncharacterized protein n=1 Tax=Tangfeifania diversioriginum TaxID=1168035 RepID=A0A1M6PT43_9BACT|nr:hypothetical protein SAMN05444280_1722 [Tangfeifania diversioriginum]
MYNALYSSEKLVIFYQPYWLRYGLQIRTSKVGNYYG